MDLLLFFKPFKRWFGLPGAIIGVFILSGFLHEMALSYPAQAGWGLPTLYFILHGFLVLFERKIKLEKHWPCPLRRLWTWFWILAPLPLLCHGTFRAELILPLYEWLHPIVTTHDLRWWFDLALWLAAAGNFCTIMAGIQVPIRFNWKEELARLSSFNERIFRTYYLFIGLTVLTFGTFTILLHDQLLNGDPVALYLSGAMGGFWLLRMIIDRFYFRDEDWPKGPEVIIGHALLNTVFIGMAWTYLSLIVWHLTLN